MADKQGNAGGGPGPYDDAITDLSNRIAGLVAELETRLAAKADTKVLTDLRAEIAELRKEKTALAAQAKAPPDANADDADGGSDDTALGQWSY